MKQQQISVIGSTGSIGVNTLRIVKTHPDRFRVCGLAAKKNIQLLAEQAREFRPDQVCIFDKTLAPALEKLMKPLKIKVAAGEEGLSQLAALPQADKVVFALVGAIGLKPIFSALEAKKDLAIANKEPLVIAGKLLVKRARERGVKILPIDSEHSGLWQCLEGHRKVSVRKLILTSSGGPFRSRKGSFAKVTTKEALNHPKWKMGAKITIDSATLMNKALEVIEAANLFEMDADRVEVLIHPEAVIHAMIEFIDGSVLANLGITDMRLPIQYALSYPDRLDNHLPTLNFTALQKFHFEAPNMKKFPCLGLGYEASKSGGTMPAVLNAANEIVVDAFLNHKISFTDIPKIAERVMRKHKVLEHPELSDLLATDQWARQEAEALI